MAGSRLSRSAGARRLLRAAARLARTEDSPDWLTLGSAPPTVAFQRSPEHMAPGWQRSGPPQQLHVDVLVRDLDVAQQQVLALGARLLEGSDKPIGYRVFADPVGHPFCLVTPESLAPPPS